MKKLLFIILALFINQSIYAGFYHSGLPENTAFFLKQKYGKMMEQSYYYNSSACPVKMYTVNNDVLQEVSTNNEYIALNLLHLNAKLVDKQYIDLEYQFILYPSKKLLQ